MIIYSNRIIRSWRDVREMIQEQYIYGESMFALWFWLDGGDRL